MRVIYGSYLCELSLRVTYESYLCELYMRFTYVSYANYLCDLSVSYL